LSSIINNNNKPSTQDDATVKNANIGSISIANINIGSSTALNNESNVSYMKQGKIHKKP
jgi:hypothetical protein